MLANNVQETTTSTSSPLALGGASENGRTFASQFVEDQPFSFFWDDGAGDFASCIGHLDGSGDLVIDQTLDGETTIPSFVPEGIVVSPSSV